MFKPISNRLNVTLLEEEVARIWKTQRVFEKRRKSRQGQQSFTVCEYPPTLSGKPGLPFVLARAHQDLWLRYKTMRGFDVQRNYGRNTHGLPFELLAERRLGLNRVGQIEQYGLERFNEFCAGLAAELIQGWETLDERLNGWDRSVDMPVTHHNEAIQAVWEWFKQAWDHEMIYQEEGITPYCPRCGTVLADYEAAMRVEHVDALGALVRLPLMEDPDTSLLVWTDRLWSLPGMVAVAASSDAEYVIVERDLTESTKPEQLILARSLVEQVFPDRSVRVYETFRGSRLKGLLYRPLFQFLLSDQPLHKVILDDFYLPDTGSGLVAVSPANNTHDFELAKENDLPVLTPIGPDGAFVPEIRPWRGVFYKEAEAFILQDLQERGLLYRVESRYQNEKFCYSCGSPLLPNLRSAWYINTQIAGKNWALSRERFWGTPIPLWQCIHCENRVAVGSLDELSRLAGRNLTGMELHRPYVDEIVFSCPDCDGLMRHVPQVLDSHLDAAVLSLYVAPGQQGPTGEADLVCEVTQQAEGWLYALNTLRLLFFQGDAFKHSINLSTPVEVRQGAEPSGRDRFNDPWDIIHDHGADALRWALLSASPAEDSFKFSINLVSESRNSLLLPLWNIYTVLVNNAAQFGWTPISPQEANTGNLTILDAWLWSRSNKLVLEVTRTLDTYDSTSAANLIQSFIADLAEWYLPRSEGRLMDSPDAADQQAAFSILYRVLVTLSQLLGPYIPYLAEEIYQKLVRPFDLSAPISVHLTDWPLAEEIQYDEKLDQGMTLARRLAAQGQVRREAAGIGNHQPLNRAVVSFGSSIEAEAMQPFDHLLKNALQVREITYQIDESLAFPGETDVALDTNLTAELVQEGLANEFIRRVYDFRQKVGYDQQATVHLFINATPRLAGAIDMFKERIMKRTHCLEIKLVSQPSDQYPDRAGQMDMGRSSRQLFTMVEFNGERATIGIEKIANP